MQSAFRNKDKELSIVVVDSNVQDREHLIQLINRQVERIGFTCRIQHWETPLKILNHVVKNIADGRAGMPESHGWDLAFLETHVEGMEVGYDFARFMQHLDPGCRVVFVTRSRDFAVEAFSVNALHYIIKPARAEQIEAVLKRFLHTDQEQDFAVSFPTPQGQVTVQPDDIAALQSERKGVRLSFLNTEKTLWTYLGFGQALERLDPHLFIQTSRGVAANIRAIRRLDFDVCYLQDDRVLPVSRSQRGHVRDRFHSYLFQDDSPDHLKSS